MTDEMVRFELGFKSGGSTGGLVPEAEWARLEAALTGDGGLVELTGSDERWLLRIEEIAWARRHQSSRRLGFGPH